MGRVGSVSFGGRREMNGLTSTVSPLCHRWARALSHPYPVGRSRPRPLAGRCSVATFGRDQERYLRNRVDRLSRRLRPAGARGKAGGPAEAGSGSLRARTWVQGCRLWAFTAVCLARQIQQNRTTTADDSPRTVRAKHTQNDKVKVNQPHQLRALPSPHLAKNCCRGCHIPPTAVKHAPLSRRPVPASQPPSPSLPAERDEARQRKTQAVASSARFPMSG